METLLIYCKKVIQEHPELRVEITEIYNLAQNEIAEGNSISNKIELAYSEIKELLDERKLS